MSKIIPHRALHEKWAMPKDSTKCSYCKEQAVVLHHDHLADYARDKLRCHLVKLNREKEFHRLWQKYGCSLLSKHRFVPTYLCQKCNEGDGWAKVRGWRGKPAVYNRYFSM